MGLSFLTPLFLAGLAAVAVPVIVHLIRRHRGTPLAFPSLMFLRKLPVRAVRRRRIRDWPLFLLRVAAIALIAAAFARPVVHSGEADAADGDAFREVVVLLDRSWSMGLGDRWERAREEVHLALDGLVAPDRVSLVHFDGAATVAVEPTLDPAEVRAVLDTLAPGWGAPRIGVGLQAAAGILEASDRARKEVLLVGDFQRRGWDDGPRDPLPPGVTLATADVGGDDAGAIGVTEVGFRHEFVDGRQRVRPWARVLRVGGSPSGGEPASAAITLHLDGREVEAREVALAAEGTAAVEFEPFFLPPEGARGSVEARLAGDRAMEPFRFVLSPDEVLTVLLVEGAGGAAGGAAPYLRSALSVGSEAPLRVVRRTTGQLAPGDVADAHVVVLDDVALPGGAVGAALRARILDGGAGLVVVAGPASAPAGWEAEWDEVLPARPGAPVERSVARGASLAGIDRDHPIFVPFTASGRGGLGSPRFYRYRSVALPDAPDSVGGPRLIARFDDGSPALLERRAGEGRVLLWTTGFDTVWSDLPLHAAFLPLVQETVRYAGLREEGAAHFPVGRALDGRFLLARAGIEESEADSVVLVAPGSSGRGSPLATAEGAQVRPDLARPGFYEVRREGTAGGGWSFAVNMEAAAADPARIDPQELALAATRGGGDVRGASGDAGRAAGVLAATPGAASSVETERRQSAWMLLLLGAGLLLLAETVLSNRGGPVRARG